MSENIENEESQDILFTVKLKQLGRNKENLTLEVPDEIVELVNENKISNKATIKRTITEKSISITYEFERIESEGE